jgi:cysteinyl-tRNA synthetase
MQTINYDEDIMTQMSNEWEKIDKTYTSLYRKVELAGLMENVRDRASEELMNEFLNGLANNFNTSLAITSLYELMKSVNKNLRSKDVSNDTLVKELEAFNDMLEILGLAPSVKPLTFEEKELVLAWQNARTNKDFESADKLRAQITEKGIVL